MKEDFDYKQVPKNYLHCLQAQCPRSADCLRYQVSRCAGAHVTYISIVNPAHVVGREELCTFFEADRLTCFALGITSLFDNLPYAKAIKIKKLLCFYLKRTTFYRIQRKERPMNPEEQSLIREVFRKEGIKEEPVFDEYFYKYSW